MNRLFIECYWNRCSLIPSYAREFVEEVCQIYRLQPRDCLRFLLNSKMVGTGEGTHLFKEGFEVLSSFEYESVKLFYPF